jgi:predicted DNA-binding protein
MEEKRIHEVRVRLSKQEMERIEKMANKLGMAKARLIRELALISLEDAELLDKLGAFEIAKALKRVKEKISKHLKTNTKLQSS